MTWTPRRILAASWLAFVLFAYPGFMKIDALDELVDARMGEISDWHSPVMTELWRIVNIVVAGPAGMLVVQSVLLVAGCYHLLRRTMSERGAAIAAACVLWFPPIVATEAQVSADTLLASVLVAAAAALASARPRVRLGGLALAAFAGGLRDGAALAALPIVVALFRRRDGDRGWRRAALALGAWAITVLAAHAASHAIVDSRTERAEVARAIDDAVGTLSRAPDLDDAELRELLAGAPLATTIDVQGRARAVYDTPRSYASGGDRVFDVPHDDAQRDALLDARVALARAAPRAYLAHRWHHLANELAMSHRFGAMYAEFVPDPSLRENVRYAAHHSLLQDTLLAPLRWLSRTFWFRPYLYAVLAIVLLPLAVARRQHAAALLLASALAHVAALFVWSVATDYRDSHWLIVATTLALVIMVSEARHERVGEQTAPRVARDEHV